jgi:hypothetical protein
MTWGYMMWFGPDCANIAPDAAGRLGRQFPGCRRNHPAVWFVSKLANRQFWSMSNHL